MSTPVDPARRNRNRVVLLLIVAIFVAPILLAGIMSRLDLLPETSRQKGELLDPKPDLRDLVPRLADGTAYAWNPQARTWRIATVARDCGGAQAAACERLLADLDKVWRLMGKDADRVELLWIGALPTGGPRPRVLRVLEPDAELLAGLPRADDPRGAPSYLIDPNGFVVLRYAPGSDPGDLRADLARLLKLK